MSLVLSPVFLSLSFRTMLSFYLLREHFSRYKTLRISIEIDTIPINP